MVPPSRIETRPDPQQQGGQPKGQRQAGTSTCSDTEPAHKSAPHSRVGHTKYEHPAPASPGSLCSKCDGFILFYSDAKPKMLLPHRDQYITRSWKSGVGHAGRDGQLDGRVVSFEHDNTPSLRNTLKKTLRNWTEMWHKCDNFQACLQAPPLGWTRYLSFSVGRSTILWKNKKFTLLKFHRRILRPKHSGFISLHIQGQSWCFIQNHIKRLVQIPDRPCALLHWSSFHRLELTGSVSLLKRRSQLLVTSTTIRFRVS